MTEKELMAVNIGRNGEDWHWKKMIHFLLLPVADNPSIHADLFAKFQTSFCADPVDAVVKALGVD